MQDPAPPAPAAAPAPIVGGGLSLPAAHAGHLRPLPVQRLYRPLASLSVPAAPARVVQLPPARPEQASQASPGSSPPAAHEQAGEVSRIKGCLPGLGGGSLGRAPLHSRRPCPWLQVCSICLDGGAPLQPCVCRHLYAHAACLVRCVTISPSADRCPRCSRSWLDNPAMVQALEVCSRSLCVSLACQGNLRLTSAHIPAGCRRHQAGSEDPGGGSTCQGC